MSRKRPIFLFAFANDKEAKLRLDKEERAVREALAERDTLETLQYLSIGQANLDDIYNTFDRYNNRIYIFHYGGHSNGEFLHLDGEDARSESLATLIGQQDSLKLAFLNGCSNAAQVNALWAKGVPAIIATNADVADEKASKLASRFYKALAGGKSIEEAFEAASSYILNSFSEPISIYRGVAFDETAQEALPWGLYVKDPSVLSWTIDDLERANWRKRVRIRWLLAIVFIAAIVAGFWLFSLSTEGKASGKVSAQSTEVANEPEKTPRLQDGTLAYYLTDSMYLGEFYNALLVIARREADSILQEVLLNNPEFQNNYYDLYKLDSLLRDTLFRDSLQVYLEEHIRTDSIKVSEIMAARLIDPSPPGAANFHIAALSEEKQYVGLQDTSFSTWEWEISPLRPGRHPLIISIAVRVESTEGAVSKNIPVYRKRVYVSADSVRVSFSSRSYTGILLLLLLLILVLMFFLQRVVFKRRI